ncbi:MAG: cyclase [Thermaceae bacterium]|nr:cyclase [Thermaceae bacterium]
MTTMFVRHKVGDYAKWKPVYDALGPTRKAKGITAAGVWHDAADPSIIIVTHRFNSLKAATEFANSEELRTAMAKAGVISQPEVWFGEEVEQTPY